MSEPLRKISRALFRQVNMRRYRLCATLARIRRALRYGFGRLSPDEAQLILIDCQRSAGWYPLLLLTVDDTLEQARRTFVDDPQIPALVAAACGRVASKWESHNDELLESKY